MQHHTLYFNLVRKKQADAPGPFNSSRLSSMSMIKSQGWTDSVCGWSGENNNLALVKNKHGVRARWRTAVSASNVH